MLENCVNNINKEIEYFKFVNFFAPSIHYEPCCEKHGCFCREKNVFV
jgi:hypothetical protein